MPRVATKPSRTARRLPTLPAAASRLGARAQRSSSRSTYETSPHSRRVGPRQLSRDAHDSLAAGRPLVLWRSLNSLERGSVRRAGEDRPARTAESQPLVEHRAARDAESALVADESPGGHGGHGGCAGHGGHDGRAGERRRVSRGEDPRSGSQRESPLSSVPSELEPIELESRWRKAAWSSPSQLGL